MNFFYYIRVKPYFHSKVAVNREYYKNGFKHNAYIQLFILHNIDLNPLQEPDGFYVQIHSNDLTSAFLYHINRKKWIYWKLSMRTILFHLEKRHLGKEEAIGHGQVTEVYTGKSLLICILLTTMSVFFLGLEPMQVFSLNDCLRVGLMPWLTSTYMTLNMQYHVRAIYIGRFVNY